MEGGLPPRVRVVEGDLVVEAGVECWSWSSSLQHL